MQPLVASATFAAAGSPAERMGVFVGIQQMEYGALAAAHLGSTGAFTATGTPFSVAAGRLSFHYGLKGPLHDCLYASPVSFQKYTSNFEACMDSGSQSSRQRPASPLAGVNTAMV